MQTANCVTDAPVDHALGSVLLLEQLQRILQRHLGISVDHGDGFSGAFINQRFDLPQPSQHTQLLDENTINEDWISHSKYLGERGHSLFEDG